MYTQMITPNLYIDEILEHWPGTIYLFFEYKMACVGCSMSAFDTLEDALKAYNLPQEAVLHSLNKQVAETYQRNSKQQ
jgi:hybrid cluster-associated redox disulfide protein